MLIQLLEYLQRGQTYSVQELAELLHKDIGSIQVELEYLENQGYIRKVAYQADCNHNCKGCHGCDQPTPAAPDVTMWEVVKRTEEEEQNETSCVGRGLFRSYPDVAKEKWYGTLY